MRILRVYLDTSIIGGYFDSEFEKGTKLLFNDVAAGRFRPVLSDLVMAELEGAPVFVRDFVFERNKFQQFEMIKETSESLALAEAYLDAGIVGRKFKDDCRHVALATVSNIDVLVSWNFKHIVRYDKIRAFNAINLMQGYNQIDIRSPLEVLHYEEE